LRDTDDRRLLGFAAIYVTGAPALAAFAFDFAPLVRWGLAAIWLLVVGGTVVTLLRRRR
jgi:hypothetical protein